MVAWWGGGTGVAGWDGNKGVQQRKITPPPPLKPKKLW